MIPPSRIRAVTFDAGGTLLEPWPSVGEVYAEVAAEHGVRADVTLLTKRFLAAWRQRRDFDYSRESWLAIVTATFDGICPATTSSRFFPALYDRFGTRRTWRLFADVMPVIESLQAAGIKLGVVSNWDERLHPLLRDLGLTSHFNSIVVSCDVGFRKPSPAMFMTAARQLALTPAEILHIGDSRREDFEGARQAGFAALFLDRTGSAAEDGTVSSLEGVLVGLRLSARSAAGFADERS